MSIMSPLLMTTHIILGYISWKGRTIDYAVVIGVEEGGPYKIKGHTDSTFTTSTIGPCELWHRRLDHVN